MTSHYRTWGHKPRLVGVIGKNIYEGSDVEWNEKKQEVRNTIFRLKVSDYVRLIDGLNINVALFSYTRAFGDGPRNFEPWSSDVDDT
ncbi:hypothetical protein TNCV_4619031 [Trichonephila clavipes]|nr:hypothetical protein TNCV_4619031 [Trichonephila clavipes]